ncbi:MAG: WYL domain-containing protein, partial [Gaiellaceae bacterium]
LRDARTAKLLYEKAIARWAVERGARPIADGSAIREVTVGSDEWLESEVLSLLGEAVVLEPPELRRAVAARGKTLAKELGVERLRARA